MSFRCVVFLFPREKPLEPVIVFERQPVIGPPGKVQGDSRRLGPIALVRFRPVLGFIIEAVFEPKRHPFADSPPRLKPQGGVREIVHDPVLIVPDAQFVIEFQAIGVGKVPLGFGFHPLLEIFVPFPQPVGPSVIRLFVRAVVQRGLHFAERVPLAILDRGGNLLARHARGFQRIGFRDAHALKRPVIFPGTQLSLVLIAKVDRFLKEYLRLVRSSDPQRFDFLQELSSLRRRFFRVAPETRSHALTG